MDLYHNKTVLFEKVQQTIYEMFEVRKYNNLKTYLYTDAYTNIIPIVSGDNSTNVTVHAFISFSKLGKDKILKFIKYLENENITRIILITMEDLTSQAKKLITDIGTFELFLVSNVLYNILKHVLQPKFSILTIDESKKLLESLQCSLVELPKMSINDPVSRFFNANPRDIFKIKRKENIYYRVVV